MLESLYNKTAGLQDCDLIKKKLQHRCFHVNIAKFLSAPILKNICERLRLTHHEVKQLLYPSCIQLRSWTRTARRKFFVHLKKKRNSISKKRRKTKKSYSDRLQVLFGLSLEALFYFYLLLLLLLVVSLLL